MTRIRIDSISLKRIVLSMALLAVSVTLTAKQKSSAMGKEMPSEQEQVLAQRVYETQISGKDSDFYEAHKKFMEYLENQQEWEKYYRTWMTRIIYEVNNRRFHRAFIEIDHLTDDIKQRHLEQYLYFSNMGMGFFYVSLPTNWMTKRHSTSISPNMTVSVSICQTSLMPPTSNK